MRVARTDKGTDNLWQEEFFMRAEDCFDKPATGRPSAAAKAAERRQAEMALKLARKNEVLSELM